MGLILDAQKIEKVIAKMTLGGAPKLHILADFDKTITETAYINGKPVGSVIGLLRAGEYLGKEYAVESYALLEKYGPLEHDQNISIADRCTKMNEWWSEHYKLLMRYGLDKNTMDKAMVDGHLKLRAGVVETFTLLHKHNIPVVIMSGGPAYMIEKQLELSGILTNNVHIIANYFEYDTAGKMTNYKQPIIHSLNKYEIILHRLPFFAELKERTNVILLGDQIDDLGMVEGFDYDNLMTIALVDKKENEELFTSKFDVVITNNGNFNFINNILKQILREDITSKQ